MIVEKQELAAFSKGSAIPASAITAPASLRSEEEWRDALSQSFARMHMNTARPNWDGYGARPVTISMLTFAAMFAQSLYREGLPLPNVVPDSMGGIDLSWILPHVDFELTIHAPYNISALIFKNDTSEELESDGLVSASSPFIRQALDSLIGGNR